MKKGTVTIDLNEYERLKANEDKLRKNSVVLFKTHSSGDASKLFFSDEIILNVNLDKKGKEEIESKFRELYHKVHTYSLDIKVRDERFEWLKKKLKEEEVKNEKLEKEKNGEPIITDFGIVYKNKKSFWCRLFNC